MRLTQLVPNVLLYGHFPNRNNESREKTLLNFSHVIQPSCTEIPIIGGRHPFSYAICDDIITAQLICFAF